MPTPTRWPGLQEVTAILRKAQGALRTGGYPYRCSPTELLAWLATDTPYPNPDPRDLLKNRYLVIHEIVEIDEVRRMGLMITKDVIVRNLEAVDVAHARAAEVEIDIVFAEGALGHVRERLEDIRNWSLDPDVTPAQKRRYRAMYRRVAKDLAHRTSAAGES